MIVYDQDPPPTSIHILPVITAIIECISDDKKLFESVVEELELKLFSVMDWDTSGT